MALARTARAALARSLARTRKRTGRASKFENTMVRALRQALPPGARVLEQFPARCAGHAYRLDAVTLWRYARPGSQGAVRAGNFGGSGKSRGPKVRVWRAIPARLYGSGWSGFARVTVRTSGEVRTVNLML